jgi:hypothetical protein
MARDGGTVSKLAHPEKLWGGGGINEIPVITEVNLDDFSAPSISTDSRLHLAKTTLPISSSQRPSEANFSQISQGY